MVSFFLKCLFCPTYEVFSTKNQKIFKIGKIGKYDEEEVFFREKKTFSFFQKPSLSKWESAKYADGRQPSSS